MIDKDSLQNEAMLEHLILQNAVEVSGVDEATGEMLYSITDRLQEVNPMLYKELKKDFEKHMFELIDKGPKIMQWRLSV